MWLAPWVTPLTFLAAFFAVFGANMLLADLRDQSRRRRLQGIEEDQLQRRRQRAREAASFYQRKGLSELAEEAFQSSRKKKTLSARLDALVEQSGVRMTPPQLSAISLLLAVAGLATGLAIHGLLLAIPLSLLLAAAPFAYLHVVRQRRLERLRAQLPDALDLMSRVLRSGQTITQAMQAVAEEFQPPVSAEFGYCSDQQNLGVSADLALRDLAERTGLLEVRILVLGLRVHRQTGGNLTELLEKLASLVRERYRIRGKIKALTAEGRLQALILLGLPPFMYGLLLFLSRDYALQLLDHPRLILGSLLGMVVGAAWIRRIVNFDF
jgi:tight adherence protein B